ncbi:hypothetical protein [Leifsonia poae]|uniref:hypothetical protein n=1 Tax=Leifsonia poae TaxID=110933 RepID=UPI003D66B6A3
MSNATPEEPTSVPDAAGSSPDTDPGLANPPSSPVSARGHVNHPEDAESGTATAPATAPAASAAATPAPATPAPAIEPEPVVASDDDIAAAVARSNTGEAPAAAAAAGDATIDTASPAESAAPVTIAAQQAAQPTTDTAATTAYDAPPAAAAAGVAAGATAPAYAAQPVTPIYVQRPEPPKKRSNRGVGILIALVGTVVFALLWAAVVALVGGLLTPGREFVDLFVHFLGSWAFRGPVIVFFVAMVLLIQVLNRARWWAYILGGLVVAVLVYASYVGSSLLDQDFTRLTAEEAGLFIGRQWVNPFAILAGVVAREVSMWTGAWLAARGRALKVRNAEAQAEYDQQLADAQNQAVAAYATPQQSGY